METHEPSRMLDDVLDAFMAATERPSYDTLRAWIRRYPQFERELTDLAASWALTEHLPPNREAIDEDRLLLRGASLVGNILHERRAARDRQEEEPSTIVSLLVRGNEIGLKFRSLAEAVGMSPALVREIDRRLIRLASIPDEAIRSLARALRCAPGAILRYLDGPPRFAPGAQYRADQAPVLGEQCDFFVAVREDKSLSAEQRARWLALAPGEE